VEFTGQSTRYSGKQKILNLGEDRKKAKKWGFNKKCHPQMLLRSRSMRGALRCAPFAGANAPALIVATLTLPTIYVRGALFGMSLSLISESVQGRTGRSFPKMCRHLLSLNF